MAATEEDVAKAIYEAKERHHVKNESFERSMQANWRDRVEE